MFSNLVSQHCHTPFPSVHKLPSSHSVKIFGLMSAASLSVQWAFKAVILCIAGTGLEKTMPLLLTFFFFYTAEPFIHICTHGQLNLQLINLACFWNAGGNGVPGETHVGHGKHMQTSHKKGRSQDFNQWPLNLEVDLLTSWPTSVCEILTTSDFKWNFIDRVPDVLLTYCNAL